MLSLSSPAQKNLSEEESSGSDVGSEVGLEPETDRFGFILTNGSTAGSVGPSPELVRQRETKWINIILQWDRMLLKKTSKVKLQCQKGIPASLRAKGWPLLCAATERMKVNENLYKSLDSQPALPNWVDVIERDLDRQFPFHEMFLSKDGHGQRGLFRVLKAYTQYQPEEGYCQAQGPVAAVLLMNMPAEEAFWCLVQISEQYLPGYYSPSLEGVLFDAGMLTWVLKRTCPAAHKHLQHHGVEPLMFATDWLMCLFTRHLPFNTLLRVWDLFFCYGVRVLLQVAVVLVRRVLGRADQRKQCQGQMETLEKLRGVREQVQEGDDAFIAEVCSLPLSSRELERQTEKELEKWRKERPSSSFDPRRRCHGFQMAWARAQHNKEERDRKERQKGNLSVPLSRSASTLSLSPSLLHKRLRKGGKANTGDWEGGSKVVRHLSMGAREECRNWNQFNFKRVQSVKEEDSEEHIKPRDSKPTAQTEENAPLEEPEKMDKSQNTPTPTEQTEETVTAKEQMEQVETNVTENEESQPCEIKDDEVISEQTEETNEETEPGPANDETTENDVQPTGQGDELDSDNSLVLQQQPDKGQDQETEVRETREDEEKQVSEREHSAPVGENQEERQTNTDADTHPHEEIQVSGDSAEEQMIQADMKPEEETGSMYEQQTQMDLVTEVSETRAETNSNIEEATLTDPDPTMETETQEDVIDETHESPHNDALELNSVEIFAVTEITEERGIQTETATEEKVEENTATTGQLQTIIIQTDSETDVDTKTEAVTAIETLILSSTEYIQQEDIDVAAYTVEETPIPVADDTVIESSKTVDHCSETECDAVATEPPQEKEEIIFREHIEAPLLDDGPREAEETLTETQMNAETPNSVALSDEEASKQIEVVNLIKEPERKSSLPEMSVSEEPASEEPAVTVGLSKEEERAGNVPQNTAEDDVFIRTPNMTDNLNTDSNPNVQNTDDSPAERNNSSLTKAIGHRSNRSSGDFCVRRSSSTRDSRSARRLSEDLFSVPQKTGQSQPISNQPDVKHSESLSNAAAANPIQTPTDVIQISKLTSLLSTEVTEETEEEKESPADSKHFGLFRRLRGQKPKKQKEKKAQKMQVPKILIQDFSDGTTTGIMVENEGAENLSSRERRRRRRESERREKEEERLKKKKEKEMEKGREREKRKPQTRGKSFQVQKQSDEFPQSTETGSKTVQYSTYAESYF
ncbi:ecotropic viral integration site 5 ortholog [Echeneis naucrates]|uniref:Ecotropic viral integration site 5 ortholog-like n=1 Tax=Echeneis naucrates TaxID=173247 RepID=A0A665T283_ECHNA|nr:ecotropic viral integration site 5 ortholog-like [Echeneis naucrates]